MTQPAWQRTRHDPQHRATGSWCSTARMLHTTCMPSYIHTRITERPHTTKVSDRSCHKGRLMYCMYRTLVSWGTSWGTLIVRHILHTSLFSACVLACMRKYMYATHQASFVCATLSCHNRTSILVALAHSCTCRRRSVTVEHLPLRHSVKAATCGRLSYIPTWCAGGGYT